MQDKLQQQQKKNIDYKTGKTASKRYIRQKTTMCFFQQTNKKKNIINL